MPKALAGTYEEIERLVLHRHAVSLDEVGDDDIVSERFARGLEDQRGLVRWEGWMEVTARHGVFKIALCKNLGGVTTYASMPAGMA